MLSDLARLRRQCSVGAKKSQIVMICANDPGIPAQRVQQNGGRPTHGFAVALFPPYPLARSERLGQVSRVADSDRPIVRRLHRPVWAEYWRPICPVPYRPVGRQSISLHAYAKGKGRVGRHQFIVLARDLVGAQNACGCDECSELRSRYVHVLERTGMLVGRQERPDKAGSVDVHSAHRPNDFSVCHVADGQIALLEVSSDRDAVERGIVQNRIGEIQNIGRPKDINRIGRGRAVQREPGQNRSAHATIFVHYTNCSARKIDARANGFLVDQPVEDGSFASVATGAREQGSTIALDAFLHPGFAVGIKVLQLDHHPNRCNGCGPERDQGTDNRQQTKGWMRRKPGIKTCKHPIDGAARSGRFASCWDEGRNPTSRFYLSVHVGHKHRLTGFERSSKIDLCSEYSVSHWVSAA